MNAAERHHANTPGWVDHQNAIENDRHRGLIQDVVDVIGKCKSESIRNMIATTRDKKRAKFISEAEANVL